MKDIDHIIDLMETGAELTDKELSMLQNDAQMRAVAEDIIIAQQVAASKNADADIDIEARLKAFKGRMDTKKRTSVIMRRLRRTAGIAAIAAGVVFFISQLMVPEQMDNVTESASKLLLTDDDGNVLPLTVHEEVGSVDPVIVAEEGVKSASHTTLDTLHLRIPHGSNYRLDLSDGSHVFLYPGLDLRMHFVFRRDGNVNDAIAMLNRMKKINARLTNNVLIID